MKAFVTGGTGFIGSHLVARLRARGDDVVALVRSPARAAHLQDLGSELAEGDLLDQEALRRGMDGCDAVFHVAGVYRVGIPASQRPAMFEANVGGTESVLDAALATGVRRVVYVSTVNVFGNTRGRIVDETYRRPAKGGFLSCYEETKFLAHRAAEERIERGLPVVIAMPGGVYGPGDHSEIGGQIERMRTGRMRFLTFPDLGFNFVHVDDAVEGLLLAHHKGRLGQSYVLGGQVTTLGELLRKVGELSDRRMPRLVMPPAMVKLSVPLSPLVTRAMGLPPNLREIIRASDGVTYWATDAKARHELGYSPRSLQEGLSRTLAAA